MNEYGFPTYEDGSYQERVHRIQLVYASYAALLALFEITSLLGVERNAEFSEKMSVRTEGLVCRLVVRLSAQDGEEEKETKQERSHRRSPMPMSPMPRSSPLRFFRLRVFWFRNCVNWRVP
jgi:hypothetical protein